MTVRIIQHLRLICMIHFENVVIILLIILKIYISFCYFIINFQLICVKD